MDRRDFLTLLGSGGLGVAASQFPLRRLVAVNPLEPRIAAYQQEFKMAACGLCSAGCSVKARLVNGHVVGLSGNKLDPMTGGGLCPKGLSLLQQLYHPDRLKKPLKRSGERGADEWEVAEWDEALEAIAGELAPLRDAAPETIVFLDGRPFGFMKLLVDRFMHVVGSPNHIADHYLDALPLATKHMMGTALHPAYDLSELDLVVSVGDAFLDTSIAPVHRARQYAQFRQGDPERRGRLLVFDDARGITAEKADDFYRIEPASYGAILLALSNVIVRYEWYDRDFVRERTRGLAEWQDKVLNRYSPEYVESLTGVAATVFYDVASRLVRAPRKLVLAGGAALTGPGGLQNAMAMLSLNALLGGIDRDLLMVSPLEELVSLPPLPEQEAFERGERLDRQRFPLATDAPWVLPEVIEENPEAVSALFLYYSNPLASHTGGAAWKEALEKIPLIVSFSPFLDESSAYADWILPESTCLERYQDFVHPPVSGMASLALSQPMWDEPLYDTRPTGDVLIELAQALDPEAETLLPWSDYSEFLDDCLAQLHGLEIGTIFVEPAKLDSYVELANRGYWSGAVEDEDAFFEQIYEKGGWVQPTYLPGQWGRLFRNDDGRFHFTSETIREDVEAFLERNDVTLASLGLEAVADTYHMPELVTPIETTPVGKLSWLVTRNTGGTTELPWWWEVVGMHRYMQWRMWAEIGTDDPHAARLDEVRPPVARFELQGQKIELPVVPRFKGHPGVLVTPVGFGRTVKRATPLPRGVNVIAAAPYRADPLTGLPSWYFAIESLATTEET